MPPAGYKRSRAIWDESRRPGAPWRARFSAILYELQPIRFQKAKQDQRVALQTAKSIVASLVEISASIPAILRRVIRILVFFKARHWAVVAGIVSYYYFVRFMHELLLAGPLIIIVTCLAFIFTIGLGDDRDRRGLSAYAVFNRGFERLMGSVDEEALMAQHVGGGLVAGGDGMGRLPPQDEDEGRRPRARQQANRRNANNDENADGEDGNNNNNRARKSGKKARRRDVAQRREMQNQRQAAAALGIGNGGAEENAAMQLLLEEQIRAGGHG